MRGRIMFGTIVIGLEQPTFVVLASDRRVTTIDPETNESEISYVQKILRHPSLPLATAIAGFGSLKMIDATSDDEETTVNSLINEHVIQSIQSESDLDINQIADKVRVNILPHVQNHRKHAKTKFPGMSRQHVILYVATCMNGVGHLNRLIVDEAVSLEPRDHSLWAVNQPPASERFYTQEYVDGKEREFRQVVTNRLRIAQIVSGMISGGISEERRVSKETTKDYENLVDCVVVDSKNGAYFTTQ